MVWLNPRAHLGLAKLCVVVVVFPCLFWSWSSLSCYSSESHISQVTANWTSFSCCHKTVAAKLDVRQVGDGSCRRSGGALSFHRLTSLCQVNCDLIHFACSVPISGRCCCCCCTNVDAHEMIPLTNAKVTFISKRKTLTKSNRICVSKLWARSGGIHQGSGRQSSATCRLARRRRRRAQPPPGSPQETSCGASCQPASRQ